MASLASEIQEEQWKAKIDEGEPGIDEIGKEEEERGRVVLINNAGVMFRLYNPANVKRTLDVNFRGTLQVCSPFT